jgi:predicted glycogen debranching enzyme
VAITFDTEACRQFDTSIAAEWLVTNGLGGYASGTVAGPNTRKYHGYLVASAHPPVQRFVVLSRVEERILVSAPSAPASASAPQESGGGVYDLSTNEFADIIHPQGYKHLISFEIGPTGGPVWRFQIGDAVIEKSLTLVHGEDTVILRYELVSPNAAPVRLQLQPMFAGRDFHATIQLHQRPWWTLSTQTDNSLAVSAPECPIKLFLSHNADKFSVNACWWYNFTFRQETQRGYPDREDLWTPGILEFTLKPRTPVGFIASTRQVDWSKAESLIAAAKARRQKLATAFNNVDPNDGFLSDLSLAADQFIVGRASSSSPQSTGGSAGLATTGASVIAGYPWFEDWGRDTFIALPGLTLVTGHFDIARNILATFADHMRRGLLPNRFPDKAPGGVTPDYNTVDASLWFVHAAYQYWRYSGDAAFLTKYLYPKLCEVMESYRDGTDFGIRADADGLIRAGDGNHQPTWMDAKIGDWVVTPRHGKPVEINALWYSNLRIMALVAKHARDAAREKAFSELAQKVESVFEKTYFNDMTRCLNDVIGDDGKPDPSIRPNQLLAVSLPFSALTSEAQKGVVATCQKLLITPMGMRTLAPPPPPGSPSYHGRCAGDQRARDMAYHQGTVWPWLIGPFVSAYVKIRGGTGGGGDNVRNEARHFLDPFKDHLTKAGLGSISEIADGDPPYTPRGCPAQAWSVGEVLRAYYEDVLNKAPAWPHEREPAPTLTPQPALAR